MEELALKAQHWSGRGTRGGADAQPTATPSDLIGVHCVVDDKRKGIEGGHREFLDQMEPFFPTLKRQGV